MDATVATAAWLNDCGCYRCYTSTTYLLVACYCISSRRSLAAAPFLGRHKTPFLFGRRRRRRRRRVYPLGFFGEAKCRNPGRRSDGRFSFLRRRTPEGNPERRSTRPSEQKNEHRFCSKRSELRFDAGRSSWPGIRPGL